MNQFYFILFSIFFACGLDYPVHHSVEEDLRVKLSHKKFEETTDAELQQILAHPIYNEFLKLGGSYEELYPKLTKGQKILFLFRKFDDIISDGGIDALLESPFASQLHLVVESLSNLDNSKLSKLSKKALKEFQSRKDHKKIDRDKFDFNYDVQQNSAFKSVEKYIRDFPEEFVLFE